MENFPRTLISQYATSPTLVQLITNINTWIDPSFNFNQFYDLVWDLDSALANDSTYGLDVWGRIVGVDRQLDVGVGSYFGFQEAGDRTGYNQSPFYAGQPTTEIYSLTNQVFYTLILAKAASNITNGTIQAINAILRSLFPNRGNCYVTDGANSMAGIYFGFQEAGDRTGYNQGPFGDAMPTLPNNMTMVYVFEFPLEPYEVAIVTNSGVLPKPAGVLATASYPGVI
jgi:Protein of unknown function (DUF2612)